MPPTRFSIHVDLWVRPLLAIFGVRSSRAYVSIEDDAVLVRFGFWEHRFPLAHVVGARRVRGNLLWGIGWHADFRRRLIVNGSLAGLVELQLAPPEPFRLIGIPGRCTYLVLSVQDPAALLQALGAN